MDLQGKRVVVTGATGFLGSHITRMLLERGAHVVGAVRTPSKGAWLEDLGAEMTAADLTDKDSLAAAFADADAVVNNAGLSTREGSPSFQEFKDANRTGVLNVVDAMAQAGVKRLVHISTVAVYKPKLRRPNDENAAKLIDGLPLAWTYLVTPWRYSLSKAQGEHLLWQKTAAAGLDVTVLRPGPIYGSRDAKLTTRYANAMRRKVQPAPTFSLPHVHASDVGMAVAGALDNAASIGRAYNVTGKPVSPFEALKTWKKLTGKGPLLLPIPLPVWVDYDDGAAERDLGFTCRGIEAGLREVLQATAEVGC